MTTAVGNGTPVDSNWGSDSMGPGNDLKVETVQELNDVLNEFPTEDSTGGGDPEGSVSGSKSEHVREKQIKPNKVYVGGLPEHTRTEDLQSGFGQMGTIVNIELKVGYGFVEFETREAAEKSVAKFHEGYFMGNKIRVELSHGGGRTAKYAGDPGACFKCGDMGHWARECPNHPPISTIRRPYDAALVDRIQPARDYPLPPPAQRDYRGGQRDGMSSFVPRERFYDPSHTVIPRRPMTPPRDYRSQPARDYDEYWRGPAPSRYNYAELDGPPAGYASRNNNGYNEPYDRYDRRPTENRRPPDRFTPPYPYAGRARTPPGPPPREDYPPPPREYMNPHDVRGRPLSPRYVADYPSRMGYRGRSASPPRPTDYDPAYGNFNAPPRNFNQREYPSRVEPYRR